VEECEADEEVVAGDEHQGAEEPAEQRVVVPDDRVLDDVREEQEDDEVEGVQLRELALAGEVDQDDEREIDRERADGLVGEAEADEARVNDEV
jgi:hypothetical protein